MANGRGGRRPGAGRKPKDAELRQLDIIDAAWPEEDQKAAVAAVAKRAGRGDVQAFDSLWKKRYGERPAEQHHTGKVKIIVEYADRLPLTSYQPAPGAE